MKKLLLLLLFCATSIYAKDFPEGLNNTKWKQTDLKNKKNYSTWEFSGSFYTIKEYKNNKLEGMITYKMTDYQELGEFLFIWFEYASEPSILEIKHDSTEYGKVALLYYGVNTKDEKSWRDAFIPLVE